MMLKRLIILVLCSCNVFAFSQANTKTDHNTKAQIFIIGTIHAMHFVPDFHYSLNDLQAQISALKPDLVCGEIAPEAYSKSMEGYYPPEAAFLSEMASMLNYRFEPVDWRLDFATQSKADSSYPAFVKEQVALFAKNYFPNMMESNSQSIYDEIHRESNIAIVDSVFEKIIGADSIAEIAHGNWNERNRRIVENGLGAAKNAQRIIFVFGSDHIPQIRRHLKELGYEPVIPERMFVPDNNFKMPEAVLKRWKLNLENLKLIRDKKVSVSDDDYNKVMNSRRIQELESAILLVP